uniref:Secreted protein n=1 Tax=uncultured microorganism TaxID=358574 RepID=F8UH26_9ZZZZ|nr:secreted protein [uncultured microorganism]
MKSSIAYLLPLWLATNPASAAESDPPASEEVARLRADVSELRAELQALRARSRPPEPAPATPEPARVAADDPPRTTPLPTTQLFAPLRADPKEPRFFVSALQVDSAPRDTTLGAVGFGEHFGIVRRETSNNEGWQLGIAGAVFAQFDLEAASSDLINADYVIGLPLTWRRGDWSGRLRLYHQSSHLGDEFLLSTQPQRVNLSFEAIEAMVAYDFGNLRLYGGGETLFDRDPADLGKHLLHAGLDWRGREIAFRLGDLGGARWVAGLDVKRWQQNDWAAQISAKAGLEFAPLSEGSGRRWNAMLEFYDGPSPYGQFYPQDVRYWGIAFQLGL